MCLAVPGKLIGLFENGGVPMGRVDFGGVSREACLAYLPEAEVGDYVLVHAGFALTKLDQEAAAQTLADLAALADLASEDPQP